MVMDKRKKALYTLLKYLGVLLALCVLLFPIYWMIICSFSPTYALTKFPPKLYPVDASLNNYVQCFKNTKFIRYLFNSIVISTGTMLVTLIIAVFSGYSISRFNFPGKRIVQTLIMSVQMFPTVVILLSLYVFYIRLGLLNTYSGVIFADATFALPLSIMLIRSFYDTVPRALDEAAYIDGASRFRTLIQIVFPLVLPGIVAVCIYTFLNSWDSYMMPSVLLTKHNMKTLPIGISEMFFGEFSNDYGGMMAFSFVGSLPILLLFIFFQKHMVAGMTAGAVKG